jgi:uncharacterized protein (DUF302 family)
MSDTRTADIVEHASPLPFAETLDRIERAITAVGMTIFARIDHAANAKDVGLVMPPTTVLLYGKAAAGTPIMLASPRAALDLPLRVLVREDEDGRALVSFRPIVPLLTALGTPTSLAEHLQPAQALLLKAFEP